MNFVERNLKAIIQILLLAVIAVVPFLRTDSLYFPFISGKAYMFRALVALAFFFWVWLLLKSPKSKAQNPKDFISVPLRSVLVGAIVVFFVAQALASFFGVDPMHSFFSSVERADGVLQYGFWVAYFLMFVSVFRTQRDWKMFFSVFAAVALALSLYSLYNQGWQAQLSGVFGNPAYFAGFLLFAIGFSLLAFERKLFYRSPVHYAFGAAAGFFSLMLIFTQVRGAYVGLAGGVFLFSVLSIMFLRKENKKLVLVCASILLLGMVSLSALFAAKETEFVRSQRLLYRVTDVAKVWETASTRERLLNWNIALKAFAEKPVFGYGSENFGTAANKYYDYRIGKGEPWFDRAHNQALDTLATGGIVVFSAYLFWLSVAGFLIFKIARKKKVLGFLSAAIFFAYFLQGFFLFDLMAVYLGLFPFLAFLIYQFYELRIDTLARRSFNEGGNIRIPNQNTLRQNSGQAKYIALVPAALLSLAIMYTSMFVPYQANATAFQFFIRTENGLYEESKPYLEKAFSVRSPYTFWEMRKRAGWQLVQVLHSRVWEETDPGTIQEISELYDFVVPELEKFIEARPFDPQMYYVLGRIYRVGSEQFGRDDLSKAEAVFQKAFQYSDLRMEYYNEYTQVLLLQGKFEEAEQSIKDYVGRVTFDEHFPYVTRGHFYFIARRYEQAFGQYEQAREAGYAFEENILEYNRYLSVAAELEDYQKIVDMAKAYLARWGEDADTYFNIAVGYLRMGDKEQVREFFLKAVEANPAYAEYEFKAFFLE